MFSDDDLKRIKGEIPEGMAKYGFDSMDTFTMEDLQSLIERLEAAEKVIQAHLLVCQDHREDEEYSDEIATKAEQAYDAWVTTGGKSPVVRDPV